MLVCSDFSASAEKYARGKMYLSSEYARKILSDVDAHHHFNVHTGSGLKNIYELSEALEIMDENTFSHHVNREKNDFANWVRDVIGDLKLAEEIVNYYERKRILKAVKNRIRELELSIAEQPRAREILKIGIYDFILGIVIGFFIGIVVKVMVG